MPEEILPPVELPNIERPALPPNESSTVAPFSPLGQRIGRGPRSFQKRFFQNEYISAGQTTYATGNGFWFGVHKSIPKISFGNSTIFVTWDEIALTITGATISGGNVDSGTYTPTITSETNLDATTTASEAQYMRVRNTVTVSGRFTANPTLTATATNFELSLPIASNIGAAEDVAGVAFCGSIAGQGAAINGVVANDTAQVEWISGDITAQTWSYTFTYQII